MAGELQDALNVSKFFSGLLAFWVERECALKALARFTVTLARAEHQTQVEEGFVNAADPAARPPAMRGLSFLEAAGDSGKCAEKDVVGRIAWRSIDCAAIPSLGNAICTSLLMDMSNAPVDQLALIAWTKSDCSAQRGERFFVAPHCAK
jgi:hypothetical protein